MLAGLLPHEKKVGHRLVQRPYGTVSRIVIDRLVNNSFSFIGRLFRFSFPCQPNPPNPLMIDFYSEFRDSLPPLPLTHVYAVGDSETELKSVAKYDKKYVHNPDGAAWAFARYVIHREYYPIMANAPELTLDEALSQMAMNTSPGYPWSRIATSKRQLLDKYNAQGNVFTMLNEYHESVKNDTAWRPIWTSSVKSEVRDTFKVADDNLRTFTAAPFEHTTSLNRACGAQNNAFYNAGANFECWSRVGMSLFNQGWDRHIRELSSVQPENAMGWELDAKQFDSSLSAELLREIRDLRMACARDKTHANLINKLYYDIIHSLIVLMTGDVVEKHMGNPSGCGNTVVDNTIALHFILAYCFYRAVQQQKLGFSFAQAHEYLRKHVSAALYGDDNTLIVHEFIRSWFNARSIALHASELGITITADFWDERPVHELGFLSHGTVMTRAGVYMPVGNSPKLLASLLTGTKILDPAWFLMRINAMRIEAFWDKPTYDILNRMRAWLHQKYKPLATDRVVHGDVDTKCIRASDFTDSEIATLYFGPRQL